jgi:transcriptional regulator with XRE-family HTH domain
MSGREHTLLYWLGQTVREEREQRNRLQVHVAASVGVSQRTVARFESGVAWPRDPELLVEAYGDDLGVDPADLWERAIVRWRKESAGES